MGKIKSEIKRKVHKRVKYVYPYFDDGKEHFVEPDDVTFHEFEHGGVNLSHVAHYMQIGNAGDVLLPRMVRDVFTHFTQEQYQWDGYHVSQAVGNDVAHRMKKSHGMVIGGGGLFLRDTNRNNLSGWQWACSSRKLKHFDMPIVLFGVGYNRFRGQKDFSRKFKRHLSELIDRSVYFGLRNSGSIEAIKAYIPEKFHDKLRYQPCPTTLSALLYPDLIASYKEKHKMSKIVAFNYAHDRIAMRLGDRREEVMQALVVRFKRLVEEGYELHFYAHHKRDKRFLHYLDNADVSYKLIKLYRMSPLEILEAYSKPLFTLGMRGHAQMIPFGCSTPAISLISHDKLSWFLKDINHPEWGIEMRHDNFEQLLDDTLIYFIENNAKIKGQIMKSQAELMAVTEQNVKDFMLEVKKTF